MTGAPREAYAPRDFIIVSMTAVRLLNGSWEAAGCFQRIAWRAERDGYWRATMQEIADEIGVSKSTANRITKTLRDIGWVTAERENTWDATLTWRVVFEGDDVPAPQDETAGQPAEDQADTPENVNLTSSGEANDAPENVNLTPSGSTPVELSQSVNLTSPQSVNLTFPSLETEETDETNNRAAADASPRGGVTDRHLASVKPKPDGVTDRHPERQRPLTSMPAEDAGTPEKIAQEWWDYFQANHGPVMRSGKSNPFIALRDNLVAPALAAGYTEREIKFALAGPPGATPDAVPAKPIFQRRLTEVRQQGQVQAPGGRGGQPSNVHHSNDPEQRAKILEGWQ